jgi:hypothetical protein
MRQCPSHSNKQGGVTRSVLILLLVAVIGGCAIYSSDRLEEFFGPAKPRERMETADSIAAATYVNQVQPILEQRCVVCHGCYDSPCQLNMASPEGIDRGASKDRVYIYTGYTRFTEAAPTRLFEDAQTTTEWRGMGFYPVLNEHQQTPTANLLASVIHHMLKLKRDNPLPDDAILADSFDLRLDHKQQCPAPNEMDAFIDKYPLSGMPYALPGLADNEFNILEKWLKNGARMALPPMHSNETQAEIDRWESFLNGDSAKQRLMSRYLFEHWFLAHLYFSDLEDGEFFRIFRSSTPPGQPIELIPSRRPYDDPGVERVYYRLWRDHATVLDKTHMPYALNARRMQWLHALFLEADYTVASLPSYEPEVAANPFIAFGAIPVENRWRFLLQDAQFTVMNFIKGPVCRGQVALNVIRDHFWVFFTDPQLEHSEDASAFLSEQEGNLQIPAQAGSNAAPIATWNKYSKSQEAYLEAKAAQMNRAFPDGKHLTLDVVWDGDGDNQNAALTVFRHFDSASVVKGLVGPEPQTAWLIDYPILERIHYLLVAGFDVFGNMGHQLTTRLYMDFLRMESEFNFLALLPPETRIAEREKWYEGASKKQRSYIFGSRANFNQPSGISFKTDKPKLELYNMLQQRLAPVLNHSYSLDHAAVPTQHREALVKIQSLKGLPLMSLPQVVFLNVHANRGENHYYTVLRNNAHSNITSLLMESSNRQPGRDTLSLVNDFIGSYPSAFWRVEDKDLPALVEQLSNLTDDASYQALMDRFGVRRSSPAFWQYSDKIMAAHRTAAPIDNALLDYNRLENR